MQRMFSHPSLLPHMAQDTAASGRKPVRRFHFPPLITTTVGHYVHAGVLCNFLNKSWRVAPSGDRDSSEAIFSIEISG